jgi:hypothetical protein
MTYPELRQLLTRTHDLAVRWQLPDGTFIPDHFHLTEVGRIAKDFIDCGGVRRQTLTCQLQIWVANDLDHRLTSRKLAGILALGDSLFSSEEDPALEIEYEAGSISQFPLESVLVSETELIFWLGSKHTDCLARDVCIPGQGCC